MYSLWVSLDLFSFILKKYNAFSEKEMREYFPLSGRLNSGMAYKFIVISMVMIAKDDAKPDK